MKFVTVPIDVSAATDQVFLVIFGTGLRGRSALSSVTASLGGTDVEVLYAGPQGVLVGVDQINLRLPMSLSGKGEVDLAVVADGIEANVVKIRVK
jgi:uncharacterized protein (TIGR03437 family)